MKDDEQPKKENAEGMDSIAKTIFAPVYPVLARRFLESYGKQDGVCIDLGSGPGHLALAIAQASKMKVYALDKSEKAQIKIRKNIRDAGLEDRITPIHADVAAIPLPDASVDLVVSRGSVYFWEDLHAAFSETSRIIRPGGVTFIGGGFGNAELRDKIVPAMIARKPDWENFYRKNMSSETSERFRQEIARIDGVEGEVIREDSGVWVVMRRRSRP